MNLKDRPLGKTPDSVEIIMQLRQAELESDGEKARVSHVRDNPDINEHELTLPGPRGSLKAHKLEPSNLSSTDGPRPCMVFFHGGGMVLGTPYFGIAAVSHIVPALGIIILSVDYGRAPECKGTELTEDCYVALEWASQNASSLNIDASRIMVAGVSAGGGLAAATALMARDRQGPKICAQLLICPMLDDRCATLSCQQFETGPVFNTAWGRKGWAWVVGDETTKDRVSEYAAPGRATDLSGLPEAYLDVGSAEVFREEVVAYARKLWQAGVQAHLHVWGGGCHGFDSFEEPSKLATFSTKNRDLWIAKVFNENYIPI